MENPGNGIVVEALGNDPAGTGGDPVHFAPSLRNHPLHLFSVALCSFKNRSGILKITLAAPCRALRNSNICVFVAWNESVEKISYNKESLVQLL